MAKKKDERTFQVIQSESKEEFCTLVAKAVAEGWELVDFAVWSLSSSGNAWYYFQTLRR